MGASSPAGALIREALRDFGVPGSRIDLFGATGGEIVRSEYDGEARLIQEPESTEIAKHDLILLCEPGDATRRILSRAGAGHVMMDLVASGPAGSVPLVGPGTTTESARAHRGVIAFPHPLSLLLTEILSPLERALGVQEVIAVVLRPASDFGERGLEELRDQTVSLLRFGDPPTELFGRPLAFNVIPQDSMGAVAEPDLARRVGEEVRRLVGWDTARLSVSLILAPVFHGHALSARVTLGAPASIDQVRSALGAQICPPRGAAEAGNTPMEAAVETSPLLSAVTADGRGGFWLWAVAGDAGTAWARQAVELAGMVMES